MSPGLTALVLAGTRPGGDPLADYAGVSHKALIDIAGTAMIERVVVALAAVPAMRRIVIAIDRASVLDALTGLDAVREKLELVITGTGSGPSASVAAVLANEGTPLLVTTADHALLRPGWVDDFLARCTPAADATIGLARRAAVEAAAPEGRRTWLRFSDGDFSGCNLFYFSGPQARNVVELWQTVEQERKHPLRMIRRLGPTYALRYALGRLSLEAALNRLGVIAGGARLAHLELPDGRAAIDVDKPADLDLVRAMFADGRAA